MSETLRILVVEDNPADANFVREVLPVIGPMSYQIEWLPRLAAALTRLASPGIDLVLLDLNLPDSYGLATLQRLQQAVPRVPVVVLTSSDDEELAVAAVRAGAEDFLFKGKFNRPLLARTIRYAVERRKTAEEMRTQRVELKLQNEELRQSEAKLEEARARYFDLYDLAPVGYITVMVRGLIVETNLAAATMLGLTRGELITLPFTRFILPADQATYDLLRQQIFTTGAPQACEVRMLAKNGTQFWAHLAATAAQTISGSPLGRIVLSNITESKRAEAALQESETRFRTLIEQAGDAFELLDEKGRYLDMNSAAGRQLGYSKAELLNLSIPEIDPEVSLEQYQATFQSLVNQPPITFQSQHRRKDGTTFPVEITASIVQLGGLLRVLSLVRDITERRQAETALRESEERFRAITLHTPDHIFVQDRDLRYQFVINPQLGLTEADMVGKTDQDFLGSQDAEKLTTIKRKVLATGEPVQLETSLENSKGETEFFGGAYIPKFDSAGKADGLIGYFRNVTERRQVETRLAAAHRQVQAILESISDAFFSVDDHLVVTYFNAAAERVLRRPASEVLGRPLFDAFPEARGSVFEQKYRQAIREKQALSFEVYFGVVPYTNWYDVRVYPQAQGLSVYFQVVTERKQAAAAIQASLREKVSLLQEIHHRVKNNMQVISSLLRLQSRQVENPIAKTVLLDMINRIRSMALVHEHLYHSENLAEVDLATYLRSLCVKLFRALMVTPGAVQLRLDLAPVRLEIDQAVPCGLLVNELIANALKHAFPAGRTGELRVEFQPVAGGLQLRLRVADDGVGLPEKFDMKQLTSLGLQLVTDLTRQLGGTLTIGPGPGAAFEVLFPYRRGQPNEE